VKYSSLWIVLQRMRLPFTVIVISYVIAMIGFLIIPGVDDAGKEYFLTIFDAFYFVTYTATTIGFGETPYTFTHDQRIWASISIYLTVISWFYGIGSLVSLLQDKLFLSEIAMARFQNSVNNIKEDFVILLGYNDTTSEITKKLLDSNMRVVVVEIDQARANYLMLEGFTPHVPVLVKDAHNAEALELAGIKSIHCRGIVSLFETNILNLRVTLASKILNPHVKVVVRSSTDNDTGNLLDAGADIVENPFNIIAYQLQMALYGSSLFKLKNWLYKIDALDGKSFSIPSENIIICGYGRLGETLYKMFIKNNISPTVIEHNRVIFNRAKKDGVEKLINGNAEDKFTLKEAKIDEAKLIFVGTNNDTTNLSIVSTVKKLNKDTVIIARENELSDFSIFSHAKIDHIFLPSKILIHKTVNALINPLSDTLIRMIARKDEQWGSELLSNLIKNIGVDPVTFELNINKNEAEQIYNHIKQNNTLKLFELRRSRRDRNQHNNIIPLLIIRKDKEILLPSFDEAIELEDKILFACDDNGKEDLEYISNNMYEFHYIIHGEENRYFTNIIKNKFKGDKK